jgi:hypothetical protein
MCPNTRPIDWYIPIILYIRHTELLWYATHTCVKCNGIVCRQLVLGQAPNLPLTNLHACVCVCVCVCVWQVRTKAAVYVVHKICWLLCMWSISSAGCYINLLATCDCHRLRTLTGSPSTDDRQNLFDLQPSPSKRQACDQRSKQSDLEWHTPSAYVLCKSCSMSWGCGSTCSGNGREPCLAPILPKHQCRSSCRLLADTFRSAEWCRCLNAHTLVLQGMRQGMRCVQPPAGHLQADSCKPH